MSNEIVVAVLGTLGVIFSGAAAKKLVERWFARERDRAKLAGDAAKDDRAAGAEQRRLAGLDNEQARDILQKRTLEQDEELKQIRTRELVREREMADVRSQVARLEERSSAQEKQIGALQSDVSRWNNDYEEMRSERDAMKAERDEYKMAKHDADNKLTPLLLRASMSEREVETLKQEIERLRGQLAAALAGRDGS